MSDGRDVGGRRGQRRGRWSLFGAVVVCCLAVAGPVSAHQAGKVQLYLDGLTATGDGHGNVTVVAHVVDKDSAGPAPGFAVAVASVDGAGAAGPGADLVDKGKGNYEKTFALPNGDWTLRATAQTGLTGETAVPGSRSIQVKVEGAPGAAIVPAPTPAGASDQGQYRYRVTLGRVTLAENQKSGIQAPPSANYIPVKVNVVDPATGQGVIPEYDVVVAATFGSEIGEGYPLTYQYGGGKIGNPPGLYRGWIIVPHPGQWTFVATVSDAKTKAVLGRNSLAAALDGIPTLASAKSAATGRGGNGNKELAASQKTATKIGGILILWSHTFAAVLWGIAIGLLALLALPSGRRLLSNHGTNLLDNHLTSLVRGAMVATGLVIGTGIINLFRETVYRTPITPDQVTKVFRLPYARPYFLALGLKLAMYVVMIVASVPLIRAAHQRAQVLDDFEFSPSGLPARRQPVAAMAGGGGTSALLASEVTLDPPTATQHAQQRDEHRASKDAGKDPTSLRVALGVMALSGGVLTIALTTLKYLHVVAEGLR